MIWSALAIDAATLKDRLGYYKAERLGPQGRIVSVVLKSASKLSAEPSMIENFEVRASSCERCWSLCDDLAYWRPTCQC